jgi:uncharacterized repeat protein (TIGR01451 family)
MNGIYICLLIVVLFSIIGLGYAYGNDKLGLNGNIMLMGDGEEETPIITVTFASGYSDGSQMQYTITVTNNGTERVTNWRFKLNVPNTTTYQVWNAGGATIIQNYFAGGGLNGGQSVELTGNMIMTGFNVSDYTNPNITDIIYNYYEEDYPIGGEDAPPLTGIILSETNITIRIGETHIVNATRVPEDSVGAISWQSSNQNIAVVEGRGLIRGISAGTVTVTARHNAIIAICNVTVIDEVIPIEIKFTPSNSYNNTIQYAITVTNNTNATIANWSFRIGVPTGTTGMVYYGANYANGVFSGMNLGANAVLSFNGELNLPAGSNLSSYMNPVISEITSD